MNEDELNAALDQAALWLKVAERVCVLTGAASPDGWERNPALVWNFYNQRRANVKTVKPNPGHRAIVELEDRWGDDFTLVLRRVDEVEATERGKSRWLVSTIGPASRARSH